MPEEILKYRVELDSSDLSSQLEALRGKIDTAVGASASAATQGALPSLQSFMDMGFSPSASEFGATASVGSFASPAADFSSLGAGASGFTSNTTQFFQNLGQTLDQAAERSSLGFSKFNEDIRRIGLFSKSNFPEFGANVMSPDYNTLQEQGFGQSIAGALGFGYDPSSNMSAGAYRRAHSNVENFGSTLQENKFLALGAAAGSVIPGVGTLTGATIGGTLDMAANFFAKDAIRAGGIGEGLQAMAHSSGIMLSKNQGREIADTMVGRSKGFRANLEGISIDDMESSLGMFADSGGFSNTYTTEQFTEKVKSVLENTKKVAHSLGVFQDEAAKIMGELELKGIASPDQMPLLAGSMKVMGGFSGMSGADMMGYGIQAAEMFRGTGISAPQGFDIAVNARLLASNLSMAGPLQKEAIRQAGGIEGASASIMETGTRHMMSGLGMLQTANILGGGNLVDTDMGSQLHGAAGFLGEDPSNYFKMIALQGQVVGGMGADNIRTQTVGQYVDLAKQMGLGTDSATLTGLMSQVGGMSVSAARLMVQGAMQDPHTQLSQELLGGSVARQDAMDEVNYGPGGFIRGAWGTVMDHKVLAAGVALAPWTGGASLVAGAAIEGAWYGAKALGGALYNATKEPTTHMSEDIADFFSGKTRSRYKAVDSASLQEAVYSIEDDSRIQALLKDTSGLDAYTEKLAMQELNEYSGFASGINNPLSMLFGNQRANTRLNASYRKDFALRSRGMSEDSKDELLDYYIKYQGMDASGIMLEDALGTELQIRTAVSADPAGSDVLGAEKQLQKNLNMGNLKSALNGALDATGNKGTGSFYEIASKNIFGKSFSALNHSETIALNRLAQNSSLDSERKEYGAEIDDDLIEIKGGGNNDSIYTQKADVLQGVLNEYIGSDDYEKEITRKLKKTGKFDAGYDVIGGLLRNFETKQANGFEDPEERMLELTSKGDLTSKEEKELAFLIAVDETLDDATFDISGQVFTGSELLVKADALDIQGDIEKEVDKEMVFYAGTSKDKKSSIRKAITLNKTQQRLRGEDFIKSGAKATFSAALSLSADETKSLNNQDDFTKAYLLASDIQQSQIEASLAATADGHNALAFLKGQDTDSERLKLMTNSLNTIASAITDDAGMPALRTT